MNLAALFLYLKDVSDFRVGNSRYIRVWEVDWWIACLELFGFAFDYAIPFKNFVKGYLVLEIYSR